MSARGQRQIRRTLKQRERDDEPWAALLGDGNGNVEVAGHRELWWVRPDGDELPMVVQGGGAPRIHGYPVWIGRDKQRKKRLRVLGLNVDAAGGSSESQAVDAHAASHGLGGSDPVWIDTLQIVNLLAWASGGLSITVNGGWITTAGGAARVATTTVDLSSHVPEEGARWALVRVNTTGAVSVQAGDAVDSYADLGAEDIPAAAAGYAPLAAVRLYAGQTAISRSSTAGDVIDLRFGGGGGGASALDGLTDVTISDPEEGQALIFDGTEWVNSDIGAAGAVYSIWDANAPPETPGDEDDEFDDGTVSGWTEFDPNIDLSVSEANGKLSMLQATRAGDNVLGLYKAIPAGDFTIDTHVEMSAVNVNFFLAGAALWEDASDGAKKILTFTMRYPHSLEAILWTNWNTFSSNIVSLDRAPLTNGWLRITRSGTTYALYFSEDGQGFLRLWSGSLAFTPTHFGLSTNNVNSANDARADFEFFRYRDTAAGFAPVQGRMIDMGGGGGVSDHGELTGLEDDDHTQYHNDARGDARYLLLDASNDPLTGDLAGPDFVRTRSGTITRTDGLISSVAKTGGRTLTITRTDGLISSVSDGTRTWTISRDGDDKIDGWSVT